MITSSAFFETNVLASAMHYFVDMGLLSEQGSCHLDGLESGQLNVDYELDDVDLLDPAELDTIVANVNARARSNSNTL